MVKKRTKKNNPNKSYVVYESNFDYIKIGKLIFMALLSAGLTIFIIVTINNLLKNMKKSNTIKQAKRKIEFSTNNNLYYFDPVYLIKDLENEIVNYLLVDTRSNEEYKSGHIKQSINVPIYRDYKNIEASKIKLSEFRKSILKNNPKNKPVVLYGYFAKSQLLLDAASYLFDSGIKTQILSVSWYEFKNNPFSWMPGNDLGIVSIEKYLEGTLYENKQ